MFICVHVYIFIGAGDNRCPERAIIPADKYACIDIYIHVYMCICVYIYLSWLYLVVFLWKTICNLGDPMSLRRPAHEYACIYVYACMCIYVHGYVYTYEYM